MSKHFSFSDFTTNSKEVTSAMQKGARLVITKKDAVRAMSKVEALHFSPLFMKEVRAYSRAVTRGKPYVFKAAVAKKIIGGSKQPPMSGVTAQDGGIVTVPLWVAIVVIVGAGGIGGGVGYFVGGLDDPEEAPNATELEETGNGDIEATPQR